MEGNSVSVHRVIDAPPERIFAIVADASKHHLIDGSGTVQGESGDPAEPLTLGTEFGMSMRMGLPYRTVNKVVEFEQDRRIAWQTKVAGPAGLLMGGRIWRYDLEPVDGGVRTRVTETWDISKDRGRLVLAFTGFPERTRRNMDKTLERLAAAVTTA